jgi:hypothetical protein
MMRRRKYIQHLKSVYKLYKILKILYITNNPLTQKDVLLEKSVLKKLETETSQKINSAAQKVSCSGILETDPQKTFHHC